MPFLVPFIVAAGVPLIAAQTIVYLGTLAVSFGLSYVAGKLLNKPGEGQPSSTGGTQLDIRVDADVPRSVIFGRAATAGSLIHAQTYGVNPGSATYATVHNTNLVEIVAIADHPCDALEKVFVEGQLVTLGGSVGDRGQEIQEAGYTAGDGSKDLAVKFYDGTQTTADQWSIDTIGGHAEFPWTSAFIGRGITYARTDTRYDAKRVPGRLRWKFVVRGIKLYDPRLDTSVGGSGAHRFDDISTHAWTDNVAVICYNILRGVYVLNPSAQRQFLYGVEGTTAAQLPLAEWFAAMNECDVLVTTTGSLTEAQYRAGGEILVDTEPLEVIKELLKASGGRLVEIGGIYKLYIGAPGASILTFSDGDLLTTEGDSFRPVLGLEDRINYITATYTSTEEDWVDKVAPPRSSATWEAEDGRRLPADLQVPMVQSGYQTQRLMQQMLLRSRQQRKHQIPLSRMAFYVEPGDVVTWNSTRNGYSAKQFEVDGVDYHPNLNVSLTLTEIDPADYDWTPGTDTLPEVIAQPISAPPDAKIVFGFAAAPFTHTGTTGVERPGIKLTWTDPEDGDVTAILWQLRVAADPTNLTSGRHEEVADEQLIILSGLAPETAYEVRAKFESFEGYGSDWSLWIAVTTPAVNELTQDALDGILDDARARIEDLAQLVGEHGQIILQQNDVLIGVQSTLDETNAEGTFRIIASTTPDDALAAIEMQVKAAAMSAWASAAIQLLAYANADGTATSRIRMVADSTQFGQPGETGGDFVNLFEIGTFNDEPGIVARADIFRDDGINTKMMKLGAAETLITLDDADQTRDYNVWNNAGAGEEFSTLTAALSGDGVVVVKCIAVFNGLSLFATSTGHFISVDANGAEVYRLSFSQLTQMIDYMPQIEFAISTLPAGTNTLVAKLRLNDTGTGGTNSLTVSEIHWIVSEKHKPAVQAGGAAAATLTYRTTLTSTLLADGTTFSAVAIGTASTIRRVVVGIGGKNSTYVIRDVTIGGVVADKILGKWVTGTQFQGYMFVATVPTGTTADITIDTQGGGAFADFVMSVWTIETAAEAWVDAHFEHGTTSSPQVVDDVAIQTGGVFIAFAYTNRTALSGAWTGADAVTENVDATLGTINYAGYSFLTTESTTLDDFSLTSSAGADTGRQIVICASWR